MEIDKIYLNRTLRELNESESPAAYIEGKLQEYGFKAEILPNGTVFAYLLGDMPGKEGSLFYASYDEKHRPAAAEILTAMRKITLPTSYDSIIHHPDIEVVFSATPEAEAAPEFQKIFSQNAYLFEEADPSGETECGLDPVVTERFQIVSEGLGNEYKDQKGKASEMQQCYADHDVRTVSVSYGIDEEDYARASEMILFLAVAYHE